MSHIGQTPPKEWKSDYSSSNPGLHKLYVNTAMKILTDVNAFIGTMNDYSNLNASDFCGPVWEMRKQKINDDRAFAEAAAKLMAGEQPEDDD